MLVLGPLHRPWEHLSEAAVGEAQTKVVSGGTLLLRVFLARVQTAVLHKVFFTPKLQPELGHVKVVESMHVTATREPLAQRAVIAAVGSEQTTPQAHPFLKPRLGILRWNGV